MTSNSTPACEGRHKRPGGGHVQTRREFQARRPRKGSRSSRQRHRARHESACTTQLHRRPGGPSSLLGSRKPRGRPRPYRKSPDEPLENCLCLCQGGRQSSEVARSRRGDQSLSNHPCLGGIRSGPGDDLATSPSEGMKRRLPPQSRIPAAALCRGRWFLPPAAAAVLCRCRRSLECFPLPPRHLEP